MKTQMQTVNTKHGDSFDFEMPLPESVEEAVGVYGEENVLWILNSGLKVKLQNTARDKFRAGGSKEQVEESVRNWRPGTSTRKSAKSQVFEIITDYSDVIQNDPDLKVQAKDLVAKGEFTEALSLLKDRLDIAD